MTFVVPIVIEEHPGPSGVPVYAAYPVFAPEPRESGERLSRVLNRLTAALHKHLLELSRLPRHDELAAWIRSPVLEETTLELRLELGSGLGSQLRRFFLVGRPALGRKLWFTPALPAVTFEVMPGQDLAARAIRVLTRHFREAAKSGEAIDLETAALRGKARLATVEVTFDPAVNVRKPKASRMASLFGGAGDEEKLDGQAELRKTGQRLNDLFPDDLDRAVGREAEVGEVLRLLSAADRRPVLLVGPRKAGKTAILHEAVRRMERVRQERKAAGARAAGAAASATDGLELRVVWHVSPMRLISGMSVVGQWENRVVAILDHAAARDSVLYFDDLPGLFTAGLNSASDLNVAAVLKPALERKRVRVVAEITPEAWRVLRERDRSLADLFHVLPVGRPASRTPGGCCSRSRGNSRRGTACALPSTPCRRPWTCTAGSCAMRRSQGRPRDSSGAWRAGARIATSGARKYSRRSASKAGCDWPCWTRKARCRARPSSRNWRMRSRASRPCSRPSPTP